MTIFHRTEKENPKMSMRTNIISLFPPRKQWKQSRCSPLNRLMDKENIVHIHNGIFLSYKKKNEICRETGISGIHYFKQGDPNLERQAIYVSLIFVP